MWFSIIENAWIYRIKKADTQQAKEVEKSEKCIVLRLSVTFLCIIQFNVYASKKIKRFYSNLIHISWVVTRVAESLKHQFPTANDVITNLKSVYIAATQIQFYIHG